MEKNIARSFDVLKFEVAPLPDGRWAAQPTLDMGVHTVALGSDPLDAIAQLCGDIKRVADHYADIMSRLDTTPFETNGEE